MSLLSPIWLLAAAGVILPLLYHLRRNTPPEVIRVGSVADLSTGAATTHRRVPRDLPLLAVRCMMLVVVSLALAQPVLDAGRAGRRVIIAPQGQWAVVDSLRSSGAVLLAAGASAYPWSAALEATTGPADTLLLIAPDDASRWRGPRPALDRVTRVIPAPGSDPTRPGPPEHQRGVAAEAGHAGAPRQSASAGLWWLLLALALMERLLARRSHDAG